MFRIGFDPILDAEIQHGELIKEIDILRQAKLAEECSKPRTSSSFKLLALVGKGMTSLGRSLELRYGERIESAPVIRNESFSDDCV